LALKEIEMKTSKKIRFFLSNFGGVSGEHGSRFQKDTARIGRGNQVTVGQWTLIRKALDTVFERNEP